MLRLVCDTIVPERFKTDDTIMCSSTHHQAMRPTDPHMTLVAVADKPLSRYFKDDQVHLDRGAVPEVEIVAYEKDGAKALMIQGHPEYHAHNHPFAVLSKVLIQQYLGVHMFNLEAAKV